MALHIKKSQSDVLLVAEKMRLASACGDKWRFETLLTLSPIMAYGFVPTQDLACNLS